MENKKWSIGLILVITGSLLEWFGLKNINTILTWVGFSFPELFLGIIPFIVGLILLSIGTILLGKGKKRT